VLQQRPQVEALWDSSQEDFAKIRPILKRIPDHLNKESLIQARSAITEAKRKLQEALDLLEKAGPTRDPDVEQERLRMVEQVKRRETTLNQVEKELRAAQHPDSK
jgi:hypothetical protein